MPKVPQEIIDQVPGLAAAQRNKNITFINMDSDETSPTITEGFRDDQIQEMDMARLHEQLSQIDKEEQNLLQMQIDLNKRRQTAHAIIARKLELE